jgi:hypothetical protein
MLADILTSEAHLDHSCLSLSEVLGAQHTLKVLTLCGQDQPMGRHSLPTNL